LLPPNNTPLPRNDLQLLNAPIERVTAHRFE